jgi:hypothetical protein
MVNVCELVLKTVNLNKRKWFALEPKWYQKLVYRLSSAVSQPESFSVESQCLTQQNSNGRTWKPCISPQKGKPTVRKADGDAGLRCWKKRMLPCNRVDTGFNVTRLRKQAYVQLVFHGKIACRIALTEESK